MSEKRIPCRTILLRFEGKKKARRVEFFRAVLFKDAFGFGYASPHNRYRIRVDGKWWPKGKRQFFLQSEMKEYFWRGLKL